MNILALDTSTGNLSLALGADGEILSTANYPLRREMAKRILSCIDEFLAQSNLSVRDIQGMAVGLGPGSFTSLRIGLSTVKGLVFADRKPVAGVCSLDAVALAVKASHGSVCVLMDAKRSMVYSAMYDVSDGGLRRTGGYRLAGIDAVLQSVEQPTVFIGDAVNLFENEIKATGYAESMISDPKSVRPQAGAVLKLSWDQFEQDLTDSASSLVPMYLYEEDCQVRR